VPFDWWKIVHLLIREKNWHPDQVKRLTMNDLRVMASEQAPSEPGGGGGKITNFAEYAAMMEQRKREANSWPS